MCGPIKNLLPDIAPDAVASAPSSEFAAQIAQLHIHAAPSASPAVPTPPEQATQPAPVDTAPSADVPAVTQPQVPPQAQPAPGPRPTAPTVTTAAARKPMPQPPLPPCDTFLTVLMWMLFLVLAVLLFRKWLRYQATEFTMH